MTSMLRDKGSPKKGAARAGDPVSPVAAADKSEPAAPQRKYSSPIVRMADDLASEAIARTRESEKQSPSSLKDTLGISEIPGAKDALQLAEKALRTWADVATTLFRAVLPLAPGLVPDAGKILDSRREAAGLGREDKARPALSSAPTPSFTVEVASAKPARISLQLHPGAQASGLAAQPLFSLDRDAAKPPITAVALSSGPGGQGIEVKVEVPSSQPKGRYLGAVYDEATGTVVGGLTVEIRG
ncbi:MAG: hypothetical protein R3F14_08905 [Polyangiaceae bacterium]